LPLPVVFVTHYYTTIINLANAIMGPFIEDKLEVIKNGLFDQAALLSTLGAKVIQVVD
jgi:hypothetical protein